MVCSLPPFKTVVQVILHLNTLVPSVTLQFCDFFEQTKLGFWGFFFGCVCLFVCLFRFLGSEFFIFLFPLPSIFSFIPFTQSVICPPRGLRNHLTPYTHCFCFLCFLSNYLNITPCLFSVFSHQPLVNIMITLLPSSQ